MAAPPSPHLTRTCRDVPHVLSDSDDGRMNGVRIARALPRRWGLFTPYGPVTVALMRLEHRLGLVVSDWDPHPPPGTKDRQRFYRIAEQHRDTVTAWLETQR